MEFPKGVPIKDCISGKPSLETITVFPGEIGIAHGLEGCRLWVVEFTDVVEMGHFLPWSGFEGWKRSLQELRARKASEKPLSSYFYSSATLPSSLYRDVSRDYLQILKSAAPETSIQEQTYPDHSQLIVDFTQSRPSINLQPY